MRFLGVAALGAGAFLMVAGFKGWKLSEFTGVGLRDVVPF